MAIPRRVLAVALSAVAAGALLYVSSRRRKGAHRSVVDDLNADKDRVEAERRSSARAGRAPGEVGTPPSPSVADNAAGENGSVVDAGSAPTTSSTETARGSSATHAGAAHELALFLAGDAWHDEVGWQALWEKEGVSSPADWLRSKGRAVLVVERKKLVDHPALLAGCRRRWIVVCRYGDIDVGDAANLWNQTENA